MSQRSTEFGNKNTVKTEEENNVYKKMGNSGIRAGVESVESQPQEDDACQISQNMGIKTAEEVQEEAQKDKTSEKILIHQKII